MFNQFTDLFQTSSDPIDKLVKLNISTANAIAHQQGLLITSLFNDSMSFSQKMMTTPDIKIFVAEQAKFSAYVQNELTDAIKQTSETLTHAQKDAEEILNDSFAVFSTKVNETLVENVAVVPEVLNKNKTQPTKQAAVQTTVKTAPKKAKVKATPKTEVKATPKTEVKATPKADVKVTPKADVKVTPKTEVKVTPKTEVKATPKAEVKATPKAEVKATPKTEVKATPKTEVKATPKAEVKAMPKLEVKAMPKTEVKATPKFEIKTTPKAEVNVVSKK
jgi:phasin family protein